MFDIKPRLCFVSQFIGLESEVWMTRQLLAIEKFDPCVLTWNLCDDQALQNEDIPVHTLDYPFDWPRGLKSRAIRAWRVLLGNACATVGREKDTIRAFLKQCKPDVILCQFGFVALRILPLAMELNIPIVAHFHGLDVSSMLRYRPYRHSLIKHAPFFSGIVVVGSHQKRWFTEQGISVEKVHLIPCGVPTRQFTEKPYGHGQSEHVCFIAVSRLVEKKGCEYTIRAFSDVHKNNEKSHLRIIGEGPERTRLEALTHALGLGQAVEFCGVLSPEQVHQALLEADVFVQHSIVSSLGDSEGFGVSVAEASSCALPVVCSDSNGLRDQVLDSVTGLLVPEKDVAGMSRQMLRLANDSDLREKLGKAGRKRMVEHYDVQGQVEKLENVLLKSIC